MSIAFSKINGFVQDLAQKKHNLNSDSFAVALCLTMSASQSTAFTAGSTDLATGNGYTQGGGSLGAGSATQSSGTLTFATGTTTYTWTATGTLTFRYAVIVNTTANLIVGYFDYGSNLTLNAGDSFTWTEGSSVLTLT
jgi:hypothetical protein